MKARVSNGSVDNCALTRSQLMIWTGQRLQPDDPLYNMALSFRIYGSLDTRRFRQAFQALVANCDALRTTFSSKGSVPKQLFHESYEYDMDVVDLSGSDNVEGDLDTWIHEQALQQFDLEKSLYESTLIKIGDDEFVWYFNQHHLTTDAWSTSLIFRKMQEYYALAVAGKLGGAAVPPTFRSYVDYEAKQCDSKAMQRASAYWQSQLESPASPSSFYRPTPPDRSGRTVRMPCEIGTDRSGAIRALAQVDTFRALTEDLARFQIFSTAFFAWLYRVSGNQMLTIGTPNHNRGSSRQKNTIGLFIEIYPLRLNVEEGETFASLYKKVARRTTELLMNAPPGASGFEHNRAYDVLLNYITATFGDFDGMPVQSEWIHAEHGDRNHLVRMQVEDFDIDDEFRVFFDLNVDTFVGDERNRPARQFVRLLDAFLELPAQCIATVDILDSEERAELTLGYAPESPGDIPGQTVFDLFLEQVERSPDKTAISCGNTSLSFAGLYERVDILATRLTNAGVSHRGRVAVALPRSVDAVVAFLGIMRCGAAYVPVDPGYPQERIASMLEDAGVSRVVLASGSEVELPKGVATLYVDDPQVPQSTPIENGRGSPCTGDDTAYVIFTSGSTGLPKGVDVTHRGLANYISWAARYYIGGEALDWPLFSSLSFDLTVTSIFVPLISGGRIVIYPESRNRREITVRRLIEDNAVDILKLTPAHLSLIQVMDLSMSRLRKIIVGGENLKTDLARSISRYFGDQIEIYNEYGPTEGTIACMIHRFDPDHDVGATVPIGKALDNAQVYVLNESRMLQPRGVIGELYISGAGVARGYVNRTDLTQERFVPNPFRRGDLMYRSGDLVRSSSDGTLTCLGRADHQFKVNGIRVEPEEIEAALVAHPQITDSAVRQIERRSQSDTHERSFCVRCGLSSMHPDAMLDKAFVCHICRVYEIEADQAQAYFRTMEDLQKIVVEAMEGSRGEQDCMMLLSGGKDSTYALCQLVELGLTPLVFTLDNGYISEGAKSNIRRLVDQLGLELVVGSTDAMNEIFVDSLHRFSNVCNGCFKTIYTLSMGVAHDRGIRHIFTGLSRGQIFETRIADLFRQRIFDPAIIDRTIIEARKAYHHARDAVSEHLDTSHFADDSVFENIQFVDFYRYTDISLDEMLNYLRDSVPWVRPADTGRSTNCLINEAGIYVHNRERGYHNYALPYSWDVRLGHKDRDAARDELDDDINADNVQRILAEIGYRPRDTRADNDRKRVLTAYYVADDDIHADELKRHLALRLPNDFLPTQFVRLEQMPLTSNGKLDRDALPDPDFARPQLADAYVAAASQIETTLAGIWADILGIDKVGVNDNFFELGGDSIMNIQIVAAASKYGLRLSPQQIFDYPTISELLGVIGTASEIASQQGPVTGDVPLTPIQHRFFGMGLEKPQHYSQQVLIRASERIDTLVLQEAVRQIVSHHDALRSRFERDDKGWRQIFDGPEQVDVPVHCVSASGYAGDEFEIATAEYVSRLQSRLELRRGPLLRVVVFDRDGPDHSLILILAHHLVVDAVSWWVLLEDLEQAYRSLAAGNAVRLPPKTTSLLHWSQTLQAYAQTEGALSSHSLWHKSTSAQPNPLPLDTGLDGDNDLASHNTLALSLGNMDTETLLTRAVSMWRMQPQDLLLTALLKTISSWSGQHDLLVDLEGHGREIISDELDLLRTVGWFTSVYPVYLSVDPNENVGDTLRRVKRTLRSIPNGGIAYGALRYLSDDPAIRRTLAEQAPPLLFNYLGKWRRNVATDSVFSFHKPVMASYGGSGPRPYVFEINAAVFDGRLQIEWSYSRNLHRQDTVLGLIESYSKNVRELAAYCAATANTEFAPSDFPTADLSQTELDEIMAEFGEL